MIISDLIVLLVILIIVSMVIYFGIVKNKTTSCDSCKDRCSCNKIKNKKWIEEYRKDNPKSC